MKNDTLSRVLMELDPQTDAPTTLSEQDEQLLRTILEQPVPSPIRKRSSHLRRTLIVGGAVAATVALGLTQIDIGGKTVGASPAAAAVLERAADVTIATSDPVVGPGQYLRITTIERDWGTPILINEHPDDPPPAVINENYPVGSDGKPILFESLRTQHMWVPYDRTDTWVFDEESHGLRSYSIDAAPYLPGEKHHVWTSKGGASTNWHEYTKYQDADWYATLPRDPDALLAELLKDAHSYDPVEHYEALNEAVSPVLTSGLAPADIRAALFLALAKEPQVRIVDGATHADGRPVITVRIGYDHEMLFDRSTGQYVGNQWRSTDFPVIPGVDTDDPTSITLVRTDVVDDAPGQD